MTPFDQGFIDKCAEYNVDPGLLLYKESGIKNTLASLSAATGLFVTPQTGLAGGCRGGRCLGGATFRNAAGERAGNKLRDITLPDWAAERAKKIENAKKVKAKPEQGTVTNAPSTNITANVSK